MKCMVDGCENEATREVEVNLDGEFDSCDAIAERHVIVAVGSRTVHVCDDHPNLDDAAISLYKVLEGEWRDSYSVEVIHNVELHKIKLDGYRDTQGTLA